MLKSVLPLGDKDRSLHTFETCCNSLDRNDLNLYVSHFSIPSGLDADLILRTVLRGGGGGIVCASLLVRL